MADEDKNGTLPFEDSYHPSSRGTDVLDAIEEALKEPDKKAKEPEYPDNGADDPSLNEPTDPPPVVRPKDPDNPDPNGRFQQRINAMHATVQARERELEASRAKMKEQEERLSRLEGQGEKQTKENFETEYRSTLVALKAAKEKGDTDLEVELTEKITDMRAALRVAEAIRRYTPKAAPEPTKTPTVDPAAAAPQPVPMAANWMRMNTWFRHGDYTQETQMAHAIDGMLHAEGIDKNNPYYYNRLTEELRKRFPDLQVRGFDMRRKMGSSSATVAGVGHRPPAPNGGKGISDDQRAMAVELGIANDPIAMKAYIEMCKRQGNQQ